MARLRRARGLTQAEIGDRVGLSRRMVAYYEGQAVRPPAHVLDRLATVLRVSADELLGLRAVEGEAPVRLRWWRRLRVIEDLSPGDRRAVFRFLEALAARKKPQERRG